MTLSPKDYKQLAKIFAEQDNQRAHILANLSNKTPTIRLWTAALEKNNNAFFAIVDANNNPVWYGNFFDDDRIRIPNDLISAEQSVADKAIWVAHKAFEAKGETFGRLEIITTCLDLNTSQLITTGAQLGIAVTVSFDMDLRAVEMAEDPGFQRWQETHLANLVEQ